MDRHLLGHLAQAQEGVVSRRQVLAAGFDDNDVERLLRRRELARVHPGVYVNHTGPLTWAQRAWAGVLFYWPAAFCGESAMRPGRAGVATPTTPDEEPLHVAVEHPRNGVRIAGVRLHRLVNLDRRTSWNLAPPRLRFNEAVLDVCAEARTRTEAFAILADACQRRRTTPARLLVALDGRRRLRHGTWLRDALADVAAGAASVLERAYLRKVEQAHGLPRGRRQLAAGSVDGVVYRDVEYDEFGLVVELDGRVGHELTRDRWKDMDRDLVAATGRLLTVRLGWGHVDRRSCTTAARIGALLRQRGWRGAVAPCGPDCSAATPSLAQPGRSPAPGAGDRPHWAEG